MNTERMLKRFRERYAHHLEMWVDSGVYWHEARCVRLRYALAYLEKRRRREYI